MFHKRWVHSVVVLCGWTECEFQALSNPGNHFHIDHIFQDHYVLFQCATLIQAWIQLALTTRKCCSFLSWSMELSCVFLQKGKVCQNEPTNITRKRFTEWCNCMLQLNVILKSCCILEIISTLTTFFKLIMP